MRTLMLLASFALLSFAAPAHAKDVSPENTLVLQLEDGDVVIEMLPKIAPKHVAQVKKLTRMGFYDGLAWFRVIDGFMAQTGYPKGKKGGKSGEFVRPAEGKPDD